MNEQIELAWAAGFFDGEGCTYVTGKRLVMNVSQRHPEVLKRFARALNLGVVRGPYSCATKGQKDPKPRYVWNVNGLTAVKAINLIWPYLGSVKKEQAASKIAEWEARRAK